MSIYRRGKIWWFKFRFEGQIIRESAMTTSKTIAREAERTRRRDLERAINRIEQPKRMPLFKLASEEWLSSLSGLADKSLDAYRQYVRTLSAEFGDRLICDIGLDDIVRLQRRRLAEGKSPRTANYEVHALRLIIKHFNLWWPLADKVRMLKGERQPGRALSREEEGRLIAAIRNGGSPALEPLFIVSIDSGLRASEIRNLRRGDVALASAADDFEGEIVVRRSKTEAGTGRVVPLTRRAAALVSWLSSLPEAGPATYSRGIKSALDRAGAGARGAQSISAVRCRDGKAHGVEHAVSQALRQDGMIFAIPWFPALPRIPPLARRRSGHWPAMSAARCSPATPISANRPSGPRSRASKPASKEPKRPILLRVGHKIGHSLRMTMRAPCRRFQKKP
jgi:integrase